MIQAGPLTNNISAILASFEKYLFDIKQDWHIKILHTDFTNCQKKYLSTYTIRIIIGPAWYRYVAVECNS